MPLQVEELLQLLLFDDTPITLLRPGEILVWEEDLIHVARIEIKQGIWEVTGSWGEKISGRVRRGGGLHRVLRIPKDWLARPEVPIVRRPPSPDRAVEEKPKESAPVDAQLILDIFRQD